ncbi:MAG: hypothetical protein K5981_09000 [Clostridia bacterium]|nr:hypothetical protein [Clostridia bacterium]
MKALLAFLIEAVCFVGILYYYVQNRKKEQARKAREEERAAQAEREDETLE